MRVIGHFKYHIYEVKLEGSDDETEYRLICIERMISTLNDPIDQNTDMQVHPFDNLHIARDRFEHAVQYCIGRTSFTDVSIFSQRI